MVTIIHHGESFGPFQVRHKLCHIANRILLKSLKIQNHAYLGIMLLFGGVFYAIFAEGTVQPWANDDSEDDNIEKTRLK